MHVSEVVGYLFHVGVDLLASSLDKATNVILVQLGDSASGTPDSDAAELFAGQAGFMSRPAAPTQGGASCQGIAIKRNDRDIVIATRDVRCSEIWGQLKAGESCMHACSGQARVFCKANGSVVQYTTSDNTASGQSVSTYVGPDKVQFVAFGCSFTMDATGITLTAGTSSLTLGKNGKAMLAATQAEVNGSVAGISGTIQTVVGPNAVPSVGPGPSSALHGLTGTAAVPSSNVLIGS